MIDLTFDNPVYLWYLVALPLFIYTHFFLLHNSRQKAMKFANFDAIKRVTGKDLMTKNWIILIIRIVLLACIILAVAGTTFWYSGTVNQNDFVIAIDTSASMTAQDIEPTRLDAAKKYATELINGVDAKSSYALLSFAGTTFIETNLIDDKKTVIKTIELLDTSATGGTDIPGAIITGTNMLLASEQGKTIIIITDGSSTVSAFLTESLQNALEYAKKNHVIIHSIGIGSETGPIGYLPEYYNISAIYNEDTLFKISNETNGKYVQVFTNDDLEKAKAEIEQNVDKAMIPVRLSYGLMLVVLTALFLEWGLISTRYRRIP
ncbi:VWA domain-containing protein [Candidatus Woesearchaeota archaeon]|nr:VWA domain-containing protein [Candidatus Woesearchaeota archaeon]